jgi:hypothetical protein
MTSDSPLSNLLSANLFPIPVEGETVSTNIIASSDLDFELEVISSQGKVLYSNNITIKAGHNETHKLPLPADYYGVFVVRYKFKDGSYKSITGTKQ